MKYTEAILSNSTRRLLWFEVTKMQIPFSAGGNIFAKIGVPNS